VLRRKEAAGPFHGGENPVNRIPIPGSGSKTNLYFKEFMPRAGWV
jgi:hypothetical protein